MLAGIRAIHTAVFLVMAGSVFYVLYCGITGTTGRALFVSLVLLAVEGIVFYSNGRKCPLTDLAKSYGAEKGYVFDSFFPERLTRYTFPFFTTLLVISLLLLLFRAVRHL